MLQSEILQSDWLRVNEAAKYAKCSRALLYELIATGSIKSFLRKTHPANKSGTRLVSRVSIDSWMNAQAEEATPKQP
jgi:predicted DNA-binding transcriptional regulator AlpA